MIVIADTGPINYLVLIGAVDVLHPLYTRVFVPRSVVEELKQAGAVCISAVVGLVCHFSPER